MAFIDVIQYSDPTGREMVVRVPPDGAGDFAMGAQLIVAESQACVFFRDGQALDTFGPGRHTLTTQNVPLLSKLLGLVFKGGSPFRCSAVFVNLKTFTELKWGTKEPIVFRDTEFKMVRLRAFGQFSVKIKEPQIFVNEICGTKGYTRVADVENFLRDVIVQRLNDLLGETLKTVLDLPRYYNEIAAGLKAKVQDFFGKYGLECVDLILGAITPPEEVQKVIDERSSMAAIGDMGQYMQYKTAQAIPEAAKNPGGLAGAGIGLGVGMMLPGMMQAAQQRGPGGGAGPAGAACPQCNTPNQPGARFCVNCGGAMAPAAAATIPCPGCQQPVAATAKFCSGCGFKMGEKPTCPGCKAELGPGAKFCSGCGSKV